MLVGGEMLVEGQNNGDREANAGRGAKQCW